MKFYIYFYESLFLAVLISAFACFLISLYLILKRRDLNLFYYPLFFFTSFLVSLISIYSPEKTSERITSSFYAADLVFFLTLIKSIPTFYKKKNIIDYLTFLSIFISMTLISLMPFFNALRPVLFVFFNLITIYFTAPIFLNFSSKKNKIDLNLSVSDFWFLSSFFFFNITTLPENILYLFFSESTNPLLLKLGYGLSYVIWQIKYFLLLKSLLCKLNKSI